MHRNIPSKLSDLPSPLKWRFKLQQSQLISQITSLLWHHKRWNAILKNRNLAAKLTPPLFLKILQNTQNDPQISLDFFIWSKTNLAFKPDLKSHLKIIQILIQYNLQGRAKSILKEPTFQSASISTVLDSWTQICKNSDHISLFLSFLLENYPNRNSCSESIEIFKRIRAYRCVPSVEGCKALLDAFERAGDLRAMWCCFSVVIRSGVLPDSAMWILLARVFCKQGKLEMAVKLKNSGFSSTGLYNLIIDSYCKDGFSPTALDLLNEMVCKKFKPGFGTYSSILDGACKFGDVEVIDSITREMVEKGLLQAMDSLDYDLVVRKFCELGKTFAADMFVKRAEKEKIRLQESSYLCMLKAFPKQGRVNEAMKLYGMIVHKGFMINDDCHKAIANVICEEEPSEEVNKVLKDLVRNGFLPLGLSKFMDALCRRGQWREADELLNMILEKGLLPEEFCSRSLVEHHCINRRIDSALALHYKMERLGGSLDVMSYTAILNGLVLEKRIEEATQVFDCMRRRNVLSSESFSIMISALCREKEMRKAMKIHDEMLQKGFKPDEVTYKRLILEFK